MGTLPDFRLILPPSTHEFMEAEAFLILAGWWGWMLTFQPAWILACDLVIPVFTKWECRLDGQIPCYDWDVVGYSR